MNGILQKLYDRARLLAVIAAVIGAFFTGIAWAWPRIGWYSPRYIDAQIGNTQQALQDFKEEWRCSQWDKELSDKLLAQMLGDNSVETAQRIDRLRELIRTNQCARFDT